MKHQTLVRTATKSTPRDLGSELSWIAQEQARIATERTISADLAQHVEDELAAEREYRAWVAKNRPGRLSREQYCQEFGITA